MDWNAALLRSTIAQRRQHLDFHIVPFVGSVKLNKLTIDVIRKFQDDLRTAGRSHDMIKRVTTSLGGILSEAHERRLVASNPVRDMRKRRTATEKRQKKRLEIGVDIPTPDEIRRFINAVTPRWKPLLVTAVFTGLRASELRGLRWQDVDLHNGVLHVRQRLDRYNEAGRRSLARARGKFRCRRN
jgi:integrase